MGNEAFNLDEEFDSGKQTTGTSPSTTTGFNFGNWINRIVYILTNPVTCWNTIKSESETIKDFYTSYLVPLALIPAICGYLGGVIFGMTFFNTTVKANIGAGLVHQALFFVAMLVCAFLAGAIIEMLAPKFGGSADKLNGIKLYGYAMTPAFVAGIFSLIPILGLLGIIVSLYGFYLYFQGITPMTSVPQERRVGFFFASIVLTIIASAIVMWITAAISPEMYSIDQIINADDIQKSMENLGQIMKGLQ